MNQTGKNSPQTSTTQPPSQAVVAAIPVGPTPTGVAFNPSSNTVYVASFGPATAGPVQSGTVYAIDANRYTVVAAIKVGSGPIGVAVNPVTNLIYVANYEQNSLSIIDGTTNTLASTLILGSPTSSVNPRYVVVSSSTNRIYPNRGASQQRHCDQWIHE